MSTSKNTVERIFSILNDLHHNTTNGLKITRYSAYCKQHQITNNLFKVLVENKILKKRKTKLNAKGKHNFEFQWASIPPNIHMAIKLKEELIKINKRYNDQKKLNYTAKKSENSKQKINVIELPEVPEHEIITNVYEKPKPVYEIKQSKGETNVSQEPFVVQVPLSETVNALPTPTVIASNVTLSKDFPQNENARLTVNKDKPQKSISIAWGLISIKW